MSEHEDISEQLSAYLDGELSDEDARRVESALADDADLTDELARLRKTRELLQSLPRERAGEDFAAKVMRAAAQQGVLPGASPWSPASLPNPWRRYFAAAALIVFAVGLGIFFSISIYDAGPASGPQSELAIKTPGDMDSVGTIARDLTGLRDEAMKKDKARSAESLEITEGESRHTSARTPEEAESLPPDMMPNKAPAERPVAKGAPRGHRFKSVSGKAGRMAGEETGYARKDGRNEKSALRFKSRKGPAGPYDQPAVFLAGPQSTTKLVKLVAPADNEVIYTDDLAVSQKQVEAVLLANAVEITPPSQRLLQPNQANLLPSRSPHLNRKLEEKPTPPQQLQYVVYGTPDQLHRVRVQLQQDVRARQTVDQLSASIVRRNGQAKLDIESQPTIPEVVADVKEQKSASTEILKGQATTKPAENELALAQQATTQPAARGLAQAAQQDQLIAPPSQQQGWRREGLLRNQAMLITLKVRAPAE